MYCWRVQTRSTVPPDTAAVEPAGPLYDYCTIRAKIVELACFQKVGLVELVGIELLQRIENIQLTDSTILKRQEGRNSNSAVQEQTARSVITNHNKNCSICNLTSACVCCLACATKLNLPNRLNWPGSGSAEFSLM